MSVIEFYVFAGLIVAAAFLSVAARSLLYAVFFQMQAVIAVAGVLAELDASFSGFALTAAASAALLAFLVFALSVFDISETPKAFPPKAGKASVLFFVSAAAEAGWLLFKPDRTANQTAAVFPFFGGTLYASYGVCAVVFGTIVLSCLAGIATLTAAERGEK